MTLIEDLIAASALANFANGAKENGSKTISLASKSSHYKVGTRFPIQLMKLLNCGKHGHIISWTPDNRCFIVHNPQLLVKEVLPLYFEKNLKYSSFARKLHRWGFQKLSSNTFCHLRFRRGDFAGASTISCKKDQEINKQVNPYFPEKSQTDINSQTREAGRSINIRPIPSPWNHSGSFTTSQRATPFVSEDFRLFPSNEFSSRYPVIPDLLEEKLNDRLQYFHHIKPLIYPRTYISTSSSRQYLPSTFTESTRDVEFRRSHRQNNDSPFISIKSMSLEEFILHFERKRIQHKMILRNAWNAIKENHREGSSSSSYPLR